MEAADVKLRAPWRAWKRTWFRRELRPDDVMIVGYPRSGNTWLAFMVANALAPAGVSLALTDLDGAIPDVNNEYFFGKGTLRRFRGLPSPRIFRVHAAYDAAFPRVVYVLRDPRDTLVSHYHLLRFERGDVATSMREFLLEYTYFPCEWDEHVTGWVEREGEQVLVVRYEELHADPERMLARVLAFAGAPRDGEVVRAAVEAARFERMRALETTSAPELGRPAAADERRVRRGKVGGWRDEIDIELARGVEERYGKAMERVGYERVDELSSSGTR